MREAIKKTMVFKFEELSEEAQEKAMERMSDINVDYEWWDCMFEDAKTIGVEIEAFDLGRGSYCKGKFLQDELDVAENILKEHGKTCEAYQDAYEFIWDVALAEEVHRTKGQEEAEANGEQFCIDDYEFDPEYEIPDLLDEFRHTIFEDYRLLLQEEYDYRTSNEAIRETLDANEYEFTEDGKLY